MAQGTVKWFNDSKVLVLSEDIRTGIFVTIHQFRATDLSPLAGVIQSALIDEEWPKGLKAKCSETLNKTKKS
jgi:cold shock CspA family protein